MKNNREFAEKHAGEYFMYDKVRVRVVGYYAKDIQILVSVPRGVNDFGWDRIVLDSDDVFVCKSRARKYHYVLKESLRKWKRE